ncbi:VWA domain-containing protein [Vibrio makurazakiensis]|uniref:VWA domain-containing protein n=1 Tax=Vibrio makurazakiensis TaxID=2910250 RepID=UPI003D11A113
MNSLSTTPSYAKRQAGSMTVSLLALLIPALFMVIATLMISAQIMVSNRAAQAADSASLACAYSDQAQPRMLSAYQEYYQPNLAGITRLAPVNQKCNISIGYSLSALLPTFTDEDFSSNVMASGGKMEARVTEVPTAIPTEMVLVLDISGSMSGNLDSLKSILTTALNTIEQESTQANASGAVSVSIVPFESGVSANRPPWLSNEPTGVYCIDGLAYQNDTFSASLTVDNLATLHSERAVRFTPPQKWLTDCSPNSPLLPLTNQLSVVKKNIDALTVSGGTASYQGLIWGVRQLLPEWQHAWGVTASPSFGVRKKLVLLTDGDDSGSTFDQLVNAGFCNKVINQFGIEMNFIGYGVNASRLDQFQQCTNDPDKVFSANNNNQLDKYFSDILSVEYDTKLQLGKSKNTITN